MSCIPGNVPVETSAASGPSQPAPPAYTGVVQLPDGSPPLGLDGNCPVQLSEHKKWVRGNPSFGAVHRGRTYLFVSAEDQQKFLANPDHYSPVVSGNDPVLRSTPDSWSPASVNTACSITTGSTCSPASNRYSSSIATRTATPAKSCRL